MNMMLSLDSRVELIALRGGVFVLATIVTLAFVWWLVHDLRNLRRGRPVNADITFLSLGIALTWLGAATDSAGSWLFHTARLHGAMLSSLSWIYFSPAAFLGLACTALGALLHVRMLTRPRLGEWGWLGTLGLAAGVYGVLHLVPDVAGSVLRALGLA